MPALAAYPLAALAEIAGCFAICTWWRLGASIPARAVHIFYQSNQGCRQIRHRIHQVSVQIREFLCLAHHFVDENH